MTKLETCQLHKGWTKYHTDKPCLICQLEEAKEQVLKKYPHYEYIDVKLDNAIRRVMEGRRL